MYHAIYHLLTLRNTPKEGLRHVDFTISWPTMNFGHIHGGNAANRIYTCYELYMDIHLLPGLIL